MLRKRGCARRPYTEGLTLEEAYNELAFLSVGAYDTPLRPQNGAPIRATAPWKYGFKSGKSIVRIELTVSPESMWRVRKSGSAMTTLSLEPAIVQDEPPLTLWAEIQGHEYGFWANVNPDEVGATDSVGTSPPQLGDLTETPMAHAQDHRRWSQAHERYFTDSTTRYNRLATLCYNGYETEVGHLYLEQARRGGQDFTELYF
eukprot:scaffold624_cov402-Prasinococcus_capsulatus_cf.AAC.73